MPHQIHCSLNYHFLSAVNLPLFADKVKTGVFGNPKNFDPSKEPSLPITEAELSVLIAAEQQAYAAYKQGGLSQKAPYIVARKLLVSKIDLLAGYVEVVAAGEAGVIAMAGFEPTYFGEAGKQGLLTAPIEIIVSHGSVAGAINAECESFGSAHQYGCIVTEGQPLSKEISIDAAGHLVLPAGLPYRLFFDLNHNRKKHFTGFTKGVDYHFYFYVINNLGVSALSKAVSIKSN